VFHKAIAVYVIGSRLRAAARADHPSRQHPQMLLGGRILIAQQSVEADARRSANPAVRYRHDRDVASYAPDSETF
jgi:hypothetical protein